MIILISGASHTGKTLLAQKLLEKYKYPYLSIDHLKMGLIRTNNTKLTPLSSDEDLTNYLWNIIKEIINTTIENKQNLIIEGCYIPFTWQKDFDKSYLKEIKYVCLVMSENYINKHFNEIIKYQNIIEKRLDENCLKEILLKDNKRNLELAIENNLNYIFIDEKYEINLNNI